MKLFGWENFHDWFWFSSSMKVAVIILMTLSIMLSFKIAMDRFHPTDKIPEFKIIDADKQKEFGQLTAKVKTGLFVKNYSEFDVKKNRFVADCVVWFEFNSDEVMLNTVGMFSFENGDILSKSDPDVKIQGRKTVAKYDVKVSYKANLNYHNFPLEGHQIALVMTNNFVTPREMFFTTDNGSFRLADGIFIADWVVKDTNADAGFSESVLDSNDSTKISSRPQVAFIVSVDGKGIRKFLIIFLPIIISIFLSMFSYVSGEKGVSQRQTLSTAAISAIIGYRFVIESMIPPVGYFTTTDYFFVFMLLVSFFNFIFQTIFIWQLNYTLDLKGKELISNLNIFRKVNTAVFLVVSVVVSVGMAYILLV